MSKVKCHQDYVDKISAINQNIEIIGKYINQYEKIEVRCKKHDICWMAIPKYITESSGCKLCRSEKMKKIEPRRRVRKGTSNEIIKCKKHNYTHEEFVSKLSEMNSYILVLGNYDGYYTPLSCKCLKDGYIWDAIPRNLIDGHGCPMCANKIVLESVNDIPTTAPWMISYFQGGYDEAKLYTCKSGKKIYPKCPDCGRVKENPLAIKSIYSNHSIGCICSDKISYPNKFSYAFLNQLPVVNWQPEFSPDWAGRYRYDNYFEYNNYKYILEMDGELGHGNITWGAKEIDTIGIKRDIEKDKLAKNHDIEVIRIDCKKSEKDYISNNILNNNTLVSIIGDTFIDWDICDDFANKNILKEVCNYWNENDVDTLKIATFFNLGRGTITRYLKIGSNLGFCNYNSEIARKTSNSKPLICNDKFIFSSKNVFKKYCFNLFGFQISGNELSKHIYDGSIYKNLNFKYISTKKLMDYILLLCRS